MDGDRLAEDLPLAEEFTMRQGYISVRPTVRIREEAKPAGPPPGFSALNRQGAWPGRDRAAHRPGPL